ncbi:hypothetical protein AB6A40_005250 [Gnathostoma spinigerum]|uniref:Serine/threonine-protein kinase ATR n=1 Tax=Gnathostoma spinigerum TaxID=75299 RepID=A0ABD6EH53_9BILA
MQCSSVIEPILMVRRELLRLTNSPIVQVPVCDLLLQSCRMLRLAGHLQIAWTFLVEAKMLNVNNFEVAMEEARFLFEKGDQTQSIGILTKLLNDHFANKLEQLQNIIDSHRKSSSQPDFSQLREALKMESKEEKDNFVKVQLLLADYSRRAGACSFADLYSKYIALPQLSDPSEDLYYRVAVFLDNYLYSKNENVVGDKVILILQAYRRVLSQGRTHVFHVMPRMLTIWLDHAQRKAEEASDKSPENISSLNSAFGSIRSSVSEEKNLKDMNQLMLDAFNRLDHYVFYTSFAQLISRITHPDLDVFQSLKSILSQLLVDYPHQCLWQSISVFRCDKSKQQLRYDRCRLVYEVAKRKDSTTKLRKLISQYEYVAAAFIRVAEDNCPTGWQSQCSERYPFLSRFFISGEMDSSVKMSEPVAATNDELPTIVIPLREMIEHAIPTPVPLSLSQFHRGISSSNYHHDDSFKNIYIQSVEEKFLVLKSMVRPKKLTLIASDGNRYSVMCKAKDELRKDSRLMDINRMVNALLHQNADARRRQLSVRTYNVIPLQDAGGLIEWIPNLETFRCILEPLIAEKVHPVMTDKDWFKRWIPNGSVEAKIERLRSVYYPKHPLVMAEWFLRNFPDPCKWYAARLAFTHTSAVISMVGFILGLGDRHAENLLIDVMSGDTFHVDFNLLFNKGENLNVPEIVPFRLTRNIVNAFGATGVEGAFRRSCETTMRVLKENDEVLLTVLQTFVHDPLLEWIQSEKRTQQVKQHHGKTAAISASVAKQQANEAIDMIRSRLKGNIVSPRIYRNTLDCLPMSVEGQVGKLIQLAVDEVNLAQMYIGWCPFL